MKDLNVFILAAGRGERLRPLTDHLPKPLMPVLGRPMLDIIVERLTVLPVRHIGVNMSHKWEMIRQWADSSPAAHSIELFREYQTLGTGGALKNASALLEQSLFLVHNADILSEIDLKKLVEAHIAADNIVTLAVHDSMPHNNVWIDVRGMVKLVGKDLAPDGLKPIAYTGIAVYSPEFLDLLPEGPSDVLDAWRLAIGGGLRVGTADFTGAFWSDIGSPSSYLAAVLQILQREGEMVYIHPSVDCSQAEIQGRAVLEAGCVIEGGLVIRDSIVLPGAHGRGKGLLENSIAGQDCIIKVEQRPSHLFNPPPSGLPVEFDALLIGTGGSDRKYYRVGDRETTMVLMESPVEDHDYERLMEYARFFEKCGVPAARLIPEGPETAPFSLPKTGPFRHAFFEDLGDISLYTWLRCPREDRRIEEVYKRVLDILIRLQTEVTGRMHECPLLASRLFDYAHFRWETDYFLERFVEGLLRLEVKERKGLITEFEALARKAVSAKKTFVHRDLQSQNIMLTPAGAPRLIDYQGARKGPAAYDVASFLWDPYSVLSPDLRDRLLAYYLTGMHEAGAGVFDETGFMDSLLPCRLQRHMQALGAYAFLSSEKGKRYFLKHVPAAIDYLSKETEMARGEYPILYHLVSKIRETL